jgi:hypothetical protein
MIGGAGYASCLPAHSDTTLLFSMEVSMSATAQPTRGGFCVDNIFFPPAGTWTFVDSSTHTGYAPLCHGKGNQSEIDPTVPAVCFDVVQRGKQLPPDSTKASKTDQDELNKAQASDTGPLEAVVYGKGERKMFDVFVTFDGDIQDLIQLGVDVDPLRLYSGRLLMARFPVDLLPKVSLVKGVKEIRLGSPQEVK